MFVGIDDAVNEIQFDPFANAQAVIQSWLNSADNPEPGLTVDEDLVIRNVTDINAVLGAMHYFTQTLVFDGQVNFNLGETLCQYKEATPAPNQTWEKFAEGEILTSTIDTVNNTTTVTAKVSEQSEYAPSGFYSETVSDEDEYYFDTTTTGTIEPVKAISVSGTNEFIASLFGRARKNVEVVTENTFNQMFTDQHLQSLDTSTGLRSSLYKKELSDIVIEKGLSNVDEVWGTEVPLYYPGLYAGTTDCVGVWKGKPAIIDFKTSRKPKKKEWISDYFLQGSAYAAAHNEVYGTDIKTTVIMMIGWDKESDNMGNYQEFVVENDEFDKFSLDWAGKVQEYFDKYK